MERLPPYSRVWLDLQTAIKSEFSARTHTACLVECTLSESFRSLHTIKIHLPPKTELVPTPKASSYLGAFGTLMSSSTSSVTQDPSAPAPRVVHHDSVKIPKGFNCGLCRPATDGSLVYLLARAKQRSTLALGAYAFWVFVYDWKAGHGLQINLPEVFPRHTLAFSLYRLTSRVIGRVVGGKSRDRDTRSFCKTGGIQYTRWTYLPSSPHHNLCL